MSSTHQHVYLRQMERLPRLFEMVKVLRERVGNDNVDVEADVARIYATLTEKLEATHQHGDDNDGGDDVMSHVEVGATFASLLDVCHTFCESALQGGNADAVVVTGVAEMMTELRVGQSSIRADVYAMVGDLQQRYRQQAAEVGVLAAQARKAEREAELAAIRLREGQRQADADLRDLLAQLERAQGKLGDAHQFIARYTAAAAATPSSPAPTSSATATAATTATATDRSGSPKAKTRAVARVPAPGRGGKPSLPPSPPKSLRNILVGQHPHRSAAAIAAAKIAAAGIAGGKGGKGKAREDPAPGPAPDEAPESADVIDISLDTALHTNNVNNMDSFLSAATSSAAADAERNWLFQFRADVQRAMDDSASSGSSSSSFIGGLDFSVLSVASASSAASAGAGRGAGRMMSAKDCLSWSRKIHAFTKGAADPHALPPTPPPPPGSAGALAAPSRHTVTLEARLYLLMERKYGLRGLAVRQAATFLLSLERLTHYQTLQDARTASTSPAPLPPTSSPSSEVAAACEVSEMAAFLGAFRNELEEDYYSRVLAALVRSVDDLLLVARRQRQQQQQQQQQRGHGGGSRKRRDEVDDEPLSALTLQEWIEHVLRFLYGEADCRSVVDLLRHRHQQQHDEPAPVPFAKALLLANQPPPAPDATTATATAAPPPRTKTMPISHGEFLRVLLEYQLQQQRRFLSTIRDAFAAADDDGDGQLTAVQAVRCFDALLRQPSQQQETQQPAATSGGGGAASSLQGVVERVASAAVAREAANPGSPLHRRRVYVKKQAQLTARRKHGATSAAKAQMREAFVRLLAADHVQLDEHSKITFTALCRCITQLFVA